MAHKNSNSDISVKVGIYSSTFLSIMTIITFGFAIIAVPPTGPFCQGNCLEYPYIDSLRQYPKDYIWIYLAIFQLIGYLIFMASVYKNTDENRKIFSFTGVIFAIIASTVLLANYFIQFAVIPISLMNNETEGIAILTQYNDHGIFIALEELGYLMIGLSFFSIAPCLSFVDKKERYIKAVLLSPFLLSIIALIYISLKYGIDRSYRFEVVIITFTYLSFVSIGFMMSKYLRRKVVINPGKDYK